MRGEYLYYRGHSVPAHDAGRHGEGHGALRRVTVALLAAGAVLALGASVGAHVCPDNGGYFGKRKRGGIITPSKLS